MTQDTAPPSALQQLIEDDAVGQLRRRTGRMAALSTEVGVLKLDWVEGVARLLADSTQLEQVEAEARDIQQRGIRHIIWAGMGGSVLTVKVMLALGFCGEHDAGAPTALHQAGESIALYPLDGTDPAALNAIIREIALAKNLVVPMPPTSEPASAFNSYHQASGLDQGETSQPAFLRSLVQDVMMVGVAMGMTSEEPITHLEWFIELLQQAEVPPANHLLVMTLPGSSLDRFAHEHAVPSLPVQPDEGTGTSGRMSAPSTRIFLLPAALYLLQISDAPGQLRSMLQHAWDEYNLDMAASSPAAHPFVQLAAALSTASHTGACRLLLSMPEGWQILVAWIEQLMEESLGKGGKGIVVFEDQPVNTAAPCYQQQGLLQVHVVTELTQVAQEQQFILLQPPLASQDPLRRLAALAASFLGWQLSMALYGYLQHIPFAGQPAVENYKTRARTLRMERDPLQVVYHWQPAVREGILTLLAPPGTIDQETHGHSTRGNAENGEQEPVAARSSRVFADALLRACSKTAQNAALGNTLGYLDVTINGRVAAPVLAMLAEQTSILANERLGVPLKLREAPAAYHSTEQSEMDGPAFFISLRIVGRTSEECLLGHYTTTFLHAQAVSTWQAMVEVNRPCFLLVLEGSLDEATAALSSFFSQVEQELGDNEDVSRLFNVEKQV